MKRILRIIQILIKCSMIFILSFIWLSFFLNKTWLAFIISLSITIFLQILTTFIFKKRKNQISLKSQEQEDAQNMFFSLANMEKPIDFFTNLISSRHSNIKTTKNCIKISHSNEKSTIFYPFIFFKTLDINDIVEITKQTKKDNPNKLVICCESYEKCCLKFVKNYNFDIVIIDQYQTYSLLYKEYEFYPKITHKISQNSKARLSDFLSYSFSRARTKSYIFSAIILFIMSFFVKFSLYYYIIISVLLLFGLISFGNSKFNFKKQKELL